MRLSELLGAPVFDDGGHKLGRVDDVRLAPGAGRQKVGSKLRVDGLVIGHAASVRLGFHRSGVRGPWPLKAVFRRLEAHARYVEWEQVKSCKPNRIVVSGELHEVPAR